MTAPVILFEPRRSSGSPASPLAGVRMAKLAAAAVTASARGFGGTLAEQRHLRLVLRPTATAGQVLTEVIQPLLGADHVQSR